MQLVNHIEIRDGVGFIAGRNTKAEMVARMYIGTDHTIEDVIEQYNLSAAEVHSAIAYYYDNQESLDARYAEIHVEIRENAMTLDKLKAKIAAKKQAQTDE